MVRILICLFLTSLTKGFPQPDIRLPHLKEFSPPEEVNALQSSQKVQRSINNHAWVDNTEDTVKEVERIIQSNPDLPRLTRGEILDILDNITKHDQGGLLKSINSIRDPKALMVVKAYTPLGSGEVEELYTKAPVTTIVEEEDFNTEKPVREIVTTTTTTTTTTTEKAQTPLFSRKTTKLPEIKKPTNIPKKKPSRGNVHFKISTLSTTTEEPITSTNKYTTTARISSSTSRDIKRRRRPVVTITTTTTEMPATTFRPRRRQPPRKEIQYPNHKYPDNQTRRPVYPPEGIRIIRPPILAPPAAQINSDLEDLLPQEIEHQERFMPMPSNSMKNSYLDKFNSVSEPSIEFDIPENLKKAVADLNLAVIQNPEIGLRTSAKPSVKTEESKPHFYSTKSKSTTTTTEAPNAYAIADSLSPDMKELLKSFGLLPDPNEILKKNEEPEYNPEKAEYEPESYKGFKPLPENSESRREMEELLAKFGLLDTNSRTSKSLKKDNHVQTPDSKQNVEIKQISLDAVPDDLKPLLTEMGFESMKLSRKIREQPTIKSSEDIDQLSNITQKQHVFNPATKYVSEMEVKKLGRLLEIMRKLEKLNGTVTEEDMSKADKEELKELIISLNGQHEDNLVHLDEQKAPNPIEFDKGLNKNEVKRQKDDEKEKVETVTAESASEETKTPSVKDLEDSFGGSTDTVTEALPETTTPRRNGFYYLVDWNTFFEIDDQKGKRVNLRFQPKVGDPKRFFSVNVP